eukprot:gb/GEZN01013041.1/.p1 GENE.gb/GEZN01013041.1/~~gb/GEZN01013041.1/.p1  ORF type:complete len:315 (+),score=-20.08 gb/GEZN01013041.1/:90-947(+)
MCQTLEDVIDKLAKKGRPNLREEISISWLRYEKGLEGKPEGASWAANRLFYPSTLVHIFYAAAVEAWLQRQWLEETPELRRAITEMLCNSSHDAESMVIDCLTGTNSGPYIYGNSGRTWRDQRLLVNQWLTGLSWPELLGGNFCQKTCGEGFFGRESQFCGIQKENHNRLSTIGLAHLLHTIMTGSLISPIACQRLQKLISFGLNNRNDQNSLLKRYNNLPIMKFGEGTELWIKTAWIKRTISHSMIFACLRNKPPVMMVVFTEGEARSEDTILLPYLFSQLIDE